MKTTIQIVTGVLCIVASAHAQQAVQWKVSDGGNGHWYQLILASSPATWQDGQNYATQQGGHLATITTHAENLFLATYIQSNIAIPWGAGVDPDGCWLGGRKIGGAWTWCTGEPWSFTGWNQTQCIVGGGNQPDQDGAPELLQIACLSGGECRWDDICIESEVGSCTRPFILLEWSADCNGDGIVDYGQCHDGTLPDYNGNNIPDCCERGDVCVVGNYPIQWRTSEGGNGHWYRRASRDGRDWHQCRQAALNFGGDLASISSMREQIAIEPLVPIHVPGGSSVVFFGGSQSVSSPPNSGWAWSDGSTWDFTNWEPGQPDGGEGFLALYRYANAAGRIEWGDWPSSDPQIGYFGLEWSADCNSDGIVDYGQILQGQLVDANNDGIPDVCQLPTCADADLFRDFNVNGADLGILLSQWGAATPLTVSDINSDGVVDGADLGLLLSFWGPCD